MRAPVLNTTEDLVGPFQLCTVTMMIQYSLHVGGDTYMHATHQSNATRYYS